MPALSVRSVLFAVLALQAAAAAQELPISIDRVRAGLEREPALDVTLPEPSVHFRVQVKERQLFPELPPIDFGDGSRRPNVPFWTPGSLPRVGTTPPLVGVDLLALARSAANGISNARRARAQRAAREEVERALREFCATTHECEIR